MRAFFAILIAIMCVSCSKADANKTSADFKAAAVSVKHDPYVARAADDVKDAAKDAGVQIKAGAAQAGVELKRSGENIKDAAEQAKRNEDAKKS